MWELSTDMVTEIRTQVVGSRLEELSVRRSLEGVGITEDRLRPWLGMTQREKVCGGVADDEF